MSVLVICCSVAKNLSGLRQQPLDAHEFLGSGIQKGLSWRIVLLFSGIQLEDGLASLVVQFDFSQVSGAWDGMTQRLRPWA